MCEPLWKRKFVYIMWNIFASHDQFGQTNFYHSHSNEPLRKYTVWPLNIKTLTSTERRIRCPEQRKGGNDYYKQLIHWGRMTHPFKIVHYVRRLHWLTYLCRDLVDSVPRGSKIFLSFSNWEPGRPTRDTESNRRESVWKSLEQVPSPLQ